MDLYNKDNRVKRALVCSLLLYCGTALFSSSLAQQPPATVAATKAQIQSAFNTPNAKVVFLCQGSLWFVDFSEAAPQVRKMNGVTGAFYPVISQDGKWVLYQTGNQFEGPSAQPPAQVWMRPLAADGTPIKIADTGFVPRFVLNTAADAPEVLYSTTLCPIAASQDCYTYGKTVKRAVVNGVPQAVQTVFGGGNYFGGLSWDNRYLTTGWEGGPNCFLLDSQNGGAAPAAIHSMHVKKARMIAGAPDTVDTNVAIGTCNISRSASRVFTNTALYIDFGSGAITTAQCFHPLLKSWQPHEKIFISRIDSEDVRVFAMPADRSLVPTSSATGNGEPIKKTWENPEWSNHPYFGAASLNVTRLWPKVNNIYQRTENGELLYAMDLKNSTYLRLVQTADSSKTSTVSCQYPFLWVEVPSGFQEDSAWLGKTIWENGSGVIHPFKGNGQPAIKTGFSFDGPIVKIALYSVNGKVLSTLTPPAAARADFHHLLRQVRPGVYFIRIDGREGQHRIVPWISLAQ
jgi:hypothetical protein